MRTLTIERRAGKIGDPVAVNVLSDNHQIGQMKAEENSFTIEISKGEHSIQCEVSTPERTYRTNVYFATGSKNVKLYLEQSTFAIRLLLR